MNRAGWLAGLVSIFTLAPLFSALAQEAPVKPVGLSDDVYSLSLSALTILFVTAVVLESAFSILFNWRVFLTYFSTRGVKTIVMVAVSLVVVYVFDLDVVASLIAGYKLLPDGGTQPAAAEFAKQVAEISGPTSSIITALVLAGGSSGVYNLMKALGFRTGRQEEIEPVAPADEAWVAVKVKRVNAVGQVHVVVSRVDPLPKGEVAPAALAGTIGFARPSLRELLLRNVDRFPQNGGYVVKPDVLYRVMVEGKDKAGTTITRMDDRYYVFAPRAIIDFAVEL